MPDVSLNGIEFVIKGSSDEASESVDKLTQKLNGLKTSLSGVSSVSKFSAAVKNVGDSAKKATSPLNNFLASIKRIAFYRMIRTVIKEIAEAIKEGAQSFYDFTKKVNPQFTNYAKALDGVKAASAQMKNQLGAAFGSLYTAIAPIITSLISLVTRFANVLTMIFARLGGAGGWYRATEAAADAVSDVGGAAKEALKYLAPFDELNRLSSNNGGGGGGGGSSGSSGGNYEWVPFEDFNLGDGIASIVQWFTDAFNNAAEWLENVDWQNLASTIVTNIKEAFGKVDWSGLTQAVSRFLGAALGAVAGFLWGAISDLWESIKTTFHNIIYNDDGTKKTGEEIWNGILEGIWNAIQNVGTWIKTNIFDPFVSGFKKAFGIASPAKEMEGPGEMVGQGILEGIKKPFVAIGEWLNEHVLQPILDFFADNEIEAPFKIDLSNFSLPDLQSLKKVWNGIKTKKATLTTKLAGTKESVFKTLASKWEVIKTKTSELTANLKNNVQTSVIDKLKEGWNSIQNKTATFTANLKNNTIVQKFIDAWNSLKNKSLELKVGLSEAVTKAWNGVVDKWNGSWLAGKLGYLPRLANGGMLNAGQIFIARENGAELVGQYGSKTGVMNNEQIVTAVANGIAKVLSDMRFSVSSSQSYSYNNSGMDEESMYRAMLRALNNADREIEIDLDGEPIYRGVVSRNRKETFRTGVNPLMARA